MGEFNISLVSVVTMIEICCRGTFRNYTEKWFFGHDRLFEKYFSGTYSLFGSLCCLYHFPNKYYDNAVVDSFFLLF